MTNKPEETEADMWESQAGIVFLVHKRTKEVRYQIMTPPGPITEEATNRAKTTIGSAFGTFAALFQAWAKAGESDRVPVVKFRDSGFSNGYIRKPGTGKRADPPTYTEPAYLEDYREAVQDEAERAYFGDPPEYPPDAL